MYLNTLDVKLTPRTNVSSYNLEINQSTLEVLILILEFRLASSCHISRFLTGQDQSKYIYRKLRYIWRAGLLESFKVLSGASSSLFYMLSKKGLRLLVEQGLCVPGRIKSYPKAKTLLSWGLFKHEVQIVELASLESMNKSGALDISFKGEESSQSQDYMSNKTIEVLTPDYTATYIADGTEFKVYTEFERTKKSNEALLSKIQRYFDFLSPEDYGKYTIRLIFQSPGMEHSFWLNIILNRPSLLKLNIVTTNLDLISVPHQFLEPIYSTESTVKLSRDGRLKADISQRIKLFNFLWWN